MFMQVQITNSNNQTIVSVEGRLDTITAGDFEAKILPLVDSAGKLVIDMSGLEYISSTGLRVFLIAQKKIMQSGGRLVLCCLQPAIREIFDIAGFSTIFSIFPDQETALAS